MAIRNPVEWIVDQFRSSAVAVGSAGHDLRESHEHELHTTLPAIRRIGVADLRDALASGFEDFKASRTDVIFLCVIYPLVGLILGGISRDTICCPCCSRWRPVSRWSGRSRRWGSTR